MIPVYRLDDSIEYVTDETKTSRSRHAESLRGAIADALNEKQTERDLFCSALGCTVETAFEDMCSVKRMWHKEDGVQGYHLVQSFAAGEVTPELAHQVGLELAEKVLGGRFQVIVSTHLNTGHIHNHLLWNSVSVEDGAKYHSNRKTYAVGREIQCSLLEQEQAIRPDEFSVEAPRPEKARSSKGKEEPDR